MTIAVTVNLYSSLKNNRFDRAEVELETEADITDLLDKLDIKAAEVGIVMVNAKSGTFEQMLKSGDNVTLIPPIGGG